MWKQVEEVLNAFKVTTAFSLFPSPPSTTIISGKAYEHLEENVSDEVRIHCSWEYDLLSELLL